MVDMVAEASDLVAPYLPRLVIDWLQDEPETTHRSIVGTGVFADISGFTSLTERLAVRGKVGAEEMSDVLNLIFEQLLDAAYEYGAGLLKWGGDAVLLLFQGDRHAEMAARAAYEMQRVIARIGRIKTSAGTVQLRMSIGMASGPLECFLVGSQFRELIVAGPMATEIAHMEKIADATEIVLAPSTVALFPADSAHLLGPPKESGTLLKLGPDVPRVPSRAPFNREVALDNTFSPPLFAHLASGQADSEHRLAAVGFLQLLGTDAYLAEHGPDALARAVSVFVDTCQEAASEYDITMLSSDIYADGAKVILISGVPTSAGDDATRLLCALRRAVDRRHILPVKAGATNGRVFAGDFGPRYRRCYSITGDIVNLAARLMAHGAPGEIIATPEVLNASRIRFDCQPVPPFFAKGKDKPVEALFVGPQINAEEVPSIAELPLIGRDQEMALLLQGLEDVRAGHGRAFELIGEPGIGKSRLLNELAQVCGIPVLWAGGDIYATNSPYQPLQRLLRKELGMVDAPPRQLAKTLIRLVEAVSPHLAPWLPLIGIVAGVELAPTEAVTLLDDQVTKSRLESATSEFLGALLSEPTVFIFNDVHFMDHATVDLMAQLIQDSAARPWLIVASSRPGERATLGEVEGLTPIVLEPLGPEATDQLLVAATESSPIPLHRIETLRKRAGGNPLYLRELASAAAELGGLAELPDSLEGVIAARIDRLDAGKRRLLRSAAVLGMSFDARLLDEVLATDADRSELSTDFVGLEEFIVERDHTVEFTHHLVRQAAYEGLTFRRRTTLHARTADLLERRFGSDPTIAPELLSQQCFLGERFQSAWEYSVLAGNRARSQFANVDALECYRRAILSAHHLPSLPGPQVAEVCESLGDTYRDIGEFDSAEDVLKQARKLDPDDAIRRARIHLKLCDLRQIQARYPEALRWSSRARRELATITSPEARKLEAELAERYGFLRYIQGHYRDASKWAQVALDEARACDDRQTQARALGLLGVISAMAGEESDDAAEASLELFVELGDIRGQSRAHNVLGAAAYFRGEWDNALGHYAAAELCCQRLGRLFDAATDAANRAEILIDQGRLDEADDLLASAMPVWRATNARGEMAFGMYHQARLEARRANPVAAFELFLQARSIADELGEQDQVLLIDVGLAEAHLLGDKPDAALALLSDLALRLSRDEAAAIAPTLARIRGTAYLALGDQESGRQSLMEGLEAARLRRAYPEIAAILTELIAAWPDHDLAPAWSDERTALDQRLGIVARHRIPARAFEGVAS